MGSIVQYDCPACRFQSRKLQVGWGKAGRAKFWGALAACVQCKDVVLVDLSDPKVDRRDRRCPECNGPVKLIEGIAERVGCPQCGLGLRQKSLGAWT